MALIITQTYAKIGVDRSQSNLQIEARNARLELRQKQAKVNMDIEMPQVEIDQYESFASAGLKNDRDIIKEAAQKGNQKALAYIGKLVSDGNALASIENGANMIAELSKRDFYTIHEYNIDFIPKVGPKITVKGDVNFDPEKNSEGVNNGVDGTYTPPEININYSPSQVKVFLSQYASIKFDYNNENKINTYV
ncbi:DUF6470 family protein [Acetivibrio cellulolyticus]|uniref:DUF6470 family protein n=1 Tax=Acetivibrio cellulolyticus TaxID=35830 RepID=UPI0001E30131|nr:DUF6470 family protein [Acetivibrio cellulolyticus]